MSGLLSGDVSRDARLHRGRGGVHECVRDQVLWFEVLFLVTGFTAN
jgi:hypothetical protein